MTLPIHPELGPDFRYEDALGLFQTALDRAHPAPASMEIVQQVIQLGALLLKKNAAYGDSALSPLECFARGLTTSQRLGVRMDDKISRLSRGSADGEDPEMDLAGYLVLKRIATARERDDVVAGQVARQQALAASPALSSAVEQDRPKPTPTPVPAV